MYIMSAIRALCTCEVIGACIVNVPKALGYPDWHPLVVMLLVLMGYVVLFHGTNCTFRVWRAPLAESDKG